VLWAAPALLLTRFGPASALNWLANVPLKGSLLDELCLAAASAYIMSTCLLLASVIDHSARQLLWRRGALRVVLVPMVLVSLAVVVATSLPLFFRVITVCFPSLI